jgi:hypothetical protein
VTQRLSDEDDDWLRASMELGMLANAVVFGVDEIPRENLTEFKGPRRRRAPNLGQLVFPGECVGH